MKCATFEHKLDAWREGDLAPAEQIEMEAHAAACAACQARVERAGRLDAVLREGLTAAAAMTLDEQAAMREGVLAAVGGRQRSFWPRSWAFPRPLLRGWFRPARVAAVLALALALILGLALLNRDGAPSIPAAELVARAQAAMDEHAGLSGVLHWKMRLEQGGAWSEDVHYYDYEIWFDFDDPARYRLRQEYEDELFSEMVRDGVDHLWKYVDQPPRPGKDYPLLEGSVYPYVEEIVLSRKEMRELATWHVPAPGREDLARFADMLPDVRVVGETTMAGRRVYLLQGKLFTLRRRFNPEEGPSPIEVTVVLAVDAETYWLLGREETIEGEKEPYLVYRTTSFELLAQDQVPDDDFAYTPPPGVEVRRLEGIDAFYHQLREPALPLPEAVEAAAFVVQVPTNVPQGLEALPLVQLEERHLSEQVADQELRMIYLGEGGRQMLLVESLLPAGPAWSARLIEVGERQGWLQSDLISAHQFTILLPNWEVSQSYSSLQAWRVFMADGGEKLPPGSVMLHAWGLSVDEAVAVLESLVPYEP